LLLPGHQVYGKKSCRIINLERVLMSSRHCFRVNCSVKTYCGEGGRMQGGYTTTSAGMRVKVKVPAASSDGMEPEGFAASAARKRTRLIKGFWHACELINCDFFVLRSEDRAACDQDIGSGLDKFSCVLLGYPTVNFNVWS